MTQQTLWKIIIKVFGIFLLIDTVSVLPTTVTSMSYLITDDLQGFSFLLAFFIIILICYLLILRIFILKPEWLIEKLKLDKGFDQETIDVNISKTNVIIIASIILGGLLFIDGLPILIKQIFVFFQEQQLSGRFGDKPSTQWLILNAVKVLIGYLILANYNAFAKYIEKLGDKPE